MAERHYEVANRVAVETYKELFPVSVPGTWVKANDFILFYIHRCPRCNRRLFDSQHLHSTQRFQEASIHIKCWKCNAYSGWSKVNEATLHAVTTALTPEAPSAVPTTL